MEQHIIAQAVFLKRIVPVVALVSVPVVVEFLRTEHKHRLVPVLVILNDTQSRECLSETDRVGKNTAVVCFKLIDDGKCRILLEVVEFVPYLR